MAQNELVIQSKIDAEAFSEFAWFDMLRRRKLWRRPALFAALFAAFAAIAFSRIGRTDGAALLGGVLLAVGFGVPLVYFAHFAFSVRKRARQLNANEIAYTLTLSPEGVAVRKEAQTAEYRWDAICRAYRLERSVALYVDAGHAFLLTGKNTEAAWDAIAQYLPEDKRT